MVVGRSRVVGGGDDAVGDDDKGDDACNGRAGADDEERR